VLHRPVELAGIIGMWPEALLNLKPSDAVITCSDQKEIECGPAFIIV